MIPLIGYSVLVLLGLLAGYGVKSITEDVFDASAIPKDSKMLIAGVGGLAVVAILYAMSKKGGK